MAQGDDPKKAAIPSWQRAQSEPASTPEAETSPPPEPSNEPKPEAESAPEPAPEKEPTQPLLEQATKFLQDPSIRDAPRDKKAAFLQSKGVSQVDIDQLLEAPAASTTSSSTSTNTSSAASSTPAPTPSSSWSRSFAAAPKTAPLPDTNIKKEVPPIVTYPEFLARPQKPPPLITVSRILNTIYAAGGAATLVYVLSRYIVNPMTEDLSTARHDLLAHSGEKLVEMNEKLEEIVSVVPPQPGAGPHSRPGSSLQREDDMESLDEDPTELFHRDYGTQTSPVLSRRPSVSSDQGSVSASMADTHAHRLNTINSSLQSLLTSSQQSTETTGQLQSKLTELTSYLNELSYTSPYYGYGNSLYGANGYGSGKGYGIKSDDAVEAVKTEIRSVKGVLLSARNFPRHV